VITEFKVSSRRDLDMAEAGNVKNNAPMDAVMEMEMAETSIATQTASATIFEHMERNEKWQRRTSSEPSAASSYWWSCMERTIQQQAQELLKLHQTVGHRATMVGAWASCMVPQRLARLTWCNGSHN